MSTKMNKQYTSRPGTAQEKKHPKQTESFHLRDAEVEMEDGEWPEAICFENFIPPKNERGYVFFTLDKLLQIAPSSASLKIRLRLEEDRAFQAIVLMDSFPQHFSTLYESGSLFNLMDNMYEDLGEKFRNWKKERKFDDQEMTHPPRDVP